MKVKHLRYFISGYLALDKNENEEATLRAGTLLLILTYFPSMDEIKKEVNINHPDATEISITSISEFSKEDFEKFKPKSNGQHST